MNPHRQKSGAMRCGAHLKLPTLFLALLSCGCGGGNDGIPSPLPGAPAGPSVQGAWEIVFHSTVSPNDYTVLETNLTQSGNHVFAGAPSALVYQAKPNPPNTTMIRLSRFGGQCDSGGTDEVTFDATITSPTATSETITFTLTETGDLGSAVTTASVSTNGTQISGDYSTPASCGFPEDHGTFAGIQRSFGFVDEFSGTLNNGADSVEVMVESVTSTNLSFSGTDNGAPLLFHGQVVGFSVELNGSIAGQPVKWFALYDPFRNTFQIFDWDAKFLGSLTESI